MQSINLKASLNPDNDPAPSRLSYRIQRLWLTRSFRVLVKNILPLSFLLIIFSLILSSEKTINYLNTYFVKTLDTLAARPELSVKLISIQNSDWPVCKKALKSFCGCFAFFCQDFPFKCPLLFTWMWKEELI